MGRLLFFARRFLAGRFFFPSFSRAGDFFAAGRFLLGGAGTGRGSFFLRVTAFFDFFASLRLFLATSFFFRDVAEVGETLAGVAIAAGAEIVTTGCFLRSRAEGSFLLGSLPVFFFEPRSFFFVRREDSAAVVADALRARSMDLAAK